MKKIRQFRTHDHILKPEDKRCRKCKALKPANRDFFYIDPRRPRQLSKICLPCRQHELKARLKHKSDLEKKHRLIQKIEPVQATFSVGDISTLDFYRVLRLNNPKKKALEIINSQREKIGLPPASFVSLKFAEKFVSLKVGR